MIDPEIQSDYSALGVKPDAGPRDVRAAQTRIAGELRRQKQLARNAEEKKALEQREKRVNEIGDKLSNPEKKRAYDAENAHLTFFVPMRACAALLEERTLRITWLHNAMREFLGARGEPVAPLQDQERADFTADYSSNTLLESLLSSEEPK
jgi:curved DNA-binding protein CbpA